MKLLDKMFGTYSERQIKKIRPLADAIEAKADEYRAMTDGELRAMTDTLKDRLAAGETTDDILVDAFATVREADDRVLHKRPFYVQLLGGILLHQGRIAEMKTGEGKTLVATLPAYLNALTGRGVHIVTVNEYLARVGSEEMSRVYGFLGLSTGLVTRDEDTAAKQAAYRADITYGTNNEFGFDYLRDNMVIYKERMVQRGHHFVIVDEVDSILIDEARTPLIISGIGEDSSDLYGKADAFARTLRRFVIKEMDSKVDADSLTDEDYIVDEKARTVVLTSRGVTKAERHFGIENLSDPENTTLSHHINQAIRAHGIMKRDVDYVVKNGEVIIVDTFTGRLMPGRRYNNGLHQAIEAKEGVKIQQESKTQATITFQNYFRMYEKLSGMTGTALTEDAEFREIYNLDVVEVPTNKPMIRKDHPDAVYRTMRGKYAAVIEKIKECHEKGQPVLVGTVSIEKSELLSRMLKGAGIPHTVLNAKYHEREAEIVAQAGKKGAVTISTNMAGRGTDIMLGGNAEYLAKAQMRREDYPEDVISFAVGSAESNDETLLAARARFAALNEKYKAEIAPEADEVRAAGGLFILGTERHESRRIDNQLRGRSGRQGDPGESQFFLSLEDDLMRLFGSERVAALAERMGMDEQTPLTFSILSGSIENAQKRIEGQNFNRRKDVLSYDDVMNQQRKLIYDQRATVLNGEDISATVRDMIRASVTENAALNLSGEPAEWNLDAIRLQYMGLLTDENALKYTDEERAKLTPADVTEELCRRAMEIYDKKVEEIGEEVFREIERVVLLRNVDRHWIDHLDEMEELQEYVGLNSYANRNPISEYRIQGADLFDEMVAAIRDDTTRNILSVRKQEKPIQRVQVARGSVAGFAGGARPAPAAAPAAAAQKPAAPSPVRAEKKPGRNDPCPCGSGKKYKNCCGANPNVYVPGQNKQ